MTSSGRWSLLLALLLALAPVPARAADLTVEATVDRNSVPIDGQLVLTVSVSGGLRQAPNPELPTTLDQDWTVSSAGTSRNFSFINGQVSSSSVYRFILTPRRTGALTIGRFRVKVGNSIYESDPIAVTVTAAQGGAGQPGAGAPAPGPAPGEERQEGGGRDVFITASVSRKNPYVQEQIVLTFRFYQRVSLLESPNYTAPTTTGFWSEDLPPDRTFYENIEGQRYYVTERRTALFATAPGAFTVGPARLECAVPAVSRNIDRDPFSLFGQSMFERRRISLTSPAITVTVKPLPAGAPPGFGGAVGRFQIRAGLDKTSVPQGEPVTLNVEVSGTGNVKSVADPVFPPLPEFKVYDSASSSDVSKDGGIVRGKKTLQQILVPLKAGTLTIPPISLAYFDPEAGEYRTASTGPLVVSVTPGATTPGGAGWGGGRGAIEVVGQDVRFIRQNLGALQVIGQRPWDGGLFWFLQLLPVGLAAGALVYEKRRRRLEEDLGFARGLRSNREAARRLKKARALAAAGDAGFPGEVAAALRGYVADKFNRAAPGLTQDEIRSLLETRGVNAELIDRLLRLLDHCDMARFAPSAAALEDRQRLLDDAGELITRLRRGGL